MRRFLVTRILENKVSVDEVHAEYYNITGGVLLFYNEREGGKPPDVVKAYNVPTWISFFERNNAPET